MNHTLLAFFCCPCIMIFTRHNLRRKENVGDVCEYWWGDALCVRDEFEDVVCVFASTVMDLPCADRTKVCCCPCCTLCQMVRATKMDDWDWLKGVQTKVRLYPFAATSLSRFLLRASCAWRTPGSSGSPIKRSAVTHMRVLKLTTPKTLDRIRVLFINT